MENSYNWDDFSVGMDSVDSNSFFNRKHSKHEKFADNHFNVDGKENVRSNENAKEKNIIKAENTEEMKSSDDKNVLSQENRISSSNAATATSAKKCSKNIVTKPFIGKSDGKNYVVSNDGTVKSKPLTQVPTVCKYAEMYGKKKQAVINELLADEKKARQFHSKPAPKFNSNSAANLRKIQESLPKITAPITPKVLKTSREVEEKTRKKMEEDLKSKEPLVFRHRDPHVLREKPFVPKKVESNIELKPFNLHMEKRLQERKQYDTRYKQIMEEKRKQEEDIKQRRDEAQRRQARTNTNFKARPNPFK